VVLTGMLLVSILGSTSKFVPIGSVGIPIVFSLAFVHIGGKPITGTPGNPARRLGPALFNGTTTVLQFWLFRIASLLRGLSTAVIWKFIYLTDES
jgi:aquaporin Z